MLKHKVYKKVLVFFLVVLVGFAVQPVVAEETATSTPAEVEVTVDPIFGCMDVTADNYNPEATEDDGSCVYAEVQVPVVAEEEEEVGIPGCMDVTADNYDPEATVSDGSCVYAEVQVPVVAEEEEEEEVGIPGCMDVTADNYDPEATVSDGSCIYPWSMPAELVDNSGDTDQSTEQFSSDELRQIQEQIRQLYEQNQNQSSDSSEASFDPAIAPSTVTISVIMPDGTPPPFPVFVTFVGVGKKNFGGKIDANGQLKVTMPQGRYYTELMVVNTQYVQGEDGPSFFLEANEERDLGVVRLITKAEQDRIGQALADKTLEDNLDSELGGSNQGLASVLSMIVKLLMQILEELRALAAYVMSGNKL